jgi:hypothetical protein
MKPSKLNLGNVDVYKNALLCAIDTDLKAEWQKYLHETENHVQVVLRIFDKLKLDPTKRHRAAMWCVTLENLLSKRWNYPSVPAMRKPHSGGQPNASSKPKPRIS